MSTFLSIRPLKLALLVALLLVALAAAACGTERPTPTATPSPSPTPMFVPTSTPVPAATPTEAPRRAAVEVEPTLAPEIATALEPPATISPTPTPVPTSVLPGVASGPGKIAFVSQTDGNGEIYVMNADGSNLSRLTNHSAWDTAPTWSPYGSRIAFQSDRDGNQEIYVMNADGTNVTRLTDSPDLDIEPAWSPDGIRIAYVARVGEGNSEIFVMEADATNQTRLTFNLTRDDQPAWSPDGTRIAYVANRDIFVMNADGSHQLKLTDHPGPDEGPAWSPDGAKIAFMSPRVGVDNHDVWVMDSDGTNPIRLTNSVSFEFPASWSPDGTKILFVSLTITDEGTGLVGYNVMNADGSGSIQISTETITEPDLYLVPDWAPGSVAALIPTPTPPPGTPTPTPGPAVSGLELVGAALTEPVESPMAGVWVHGNYAYVGSQSIAYHAPDIKTGIRIVDMSDPANPALVGRIPLRSFEFGSGELSGDHVPHSHGDAVATTINSAVFQGDIAIVLQGVPDTFTVEEYPMPFGIWDVTDPTDPQFLGPLSLGNHFFADDLGDKPNDTKAVHGQYFYAIYKTGESARRYHDDKDHYLAIVDLSDPRNPVVVGDWQDTKQVHLRGFSLNAAGTRVYMMGQFEKQLLIYILDVQDPTKPVELARFVWPFPFAGGFSPGRPVANGDDSLVIFADGSWEEGRESRLHILDISDLSSIREIATIECPPAAPRWDCWAHDVAIKGNLVYSTWMQGGVQATDISDPSNPVVVGEFFSPIKREEGCCLSDVAMYGDYAVAVAVWGPGLYIVRRPG